MPTTDFKTEMSNQRDTLKLLVGNAAQVMAALKVADAQPGQDKGEMCANVMLAMRHLEDAAMRFGKAVQASDGGVSALGGPHTPGYQPPQQGVVGTGNIGSHTSGATGH